MIKGFEFVDAGRKFSCSVEVLRQSAQDRWWWFRVSTDDRHRYAPFPADAKDTQASVQARVVAYYDDLLARRAAPSVPAWRGMGRKPEPATTPPAVGTTGS
jgi:hypothetical protein